MDGARGWCGWGGGDVDGLGVSVGGEGSILCLLWHSAGSWVVFWFTCGLWPGWCLETNIMYLYLGLWAGFMVWKGKCEGEISDSPR